MSSFEHSPTSNNSSKELQISKVKNLYDTLESSAFKDLDLLEAIVKLVNKLKGHLETYDVVLSDDASGRLISLLLRKVINEARRKTGLKEAQTYFLASGRHDSEEIYENIKEFIEIKKPTFKKALLVTEYISSGQSILTLIEKIKKTGIDFDVATISTYGNLGNYPSDLTDRLFAGEITSGIGQELFRNSNATGVKKGLETSAHPVKRSSYSAVTVMEAREDIDKIAKFLYQNI
jgi:hypothetical protein